MGEYKTQLCENQTKVPQKQERLAVESNFGKNLNKHAIFIPIHTTK